MPLYGIFHILPSTSYVLHTHWLLCLFIVTIISFYHMLWQKRAIYLQRVHMMVGSSALPLLWCFRDYIGMRDGDAAEDGNGRGLASVTNPGISCVVCMAGRPSRLTPH